MRTCYHVNLLGVSRHGARHFGALKSFRFAASDVLLLQGKPADVADTIAAIDALPLSNRHLAIHASREAATAAGVSWQHWPQSLPELRLRRSQ